MWLLNTATIRLEFFEGENVPFYAILSHRWEAEEVSHQDIQDFAPIEKVGYLKVQQCCAQALKDGFNYVWIDTCCIDKKSSAELSEAINSMFKWYQEAQVCYAYLSDVVVHGQATEVWLPNFNASVWFTRGWTLQELLASNRTKFFDKTWTFIGLKNEREISQAIEETTNVPRAALLMFRASDWSVAQKMSWASTRKTTRVEDEAYCLLGLFDINMPLLYGEGRKAFFRLQEEIAKCYSDRSIFAWTGGPNCTSPIFAPSAECFKDFYTLEPVVFEHRDPRIDQVRYRNVFALYNDGLTIEVLLYPLGPRIYVAELGTDTSSQNLCIYVEKLQDSVYCERVVLNGVWSFVPSNRTLLPCAPPRRTNIILHRTSLHSYGAVRHKYYRVKVTLSLPLPYCPQAGNRKSQRDMTHSHRVFASIPHLSIETPSETAHGFYSGVYYTPDNGELVTIFCGLDFDFHDHLMVLIWPVHLSNNIRKSFKLQECCFSLLPLTDRLGLKRLAKEYHEMTDPSSGGRLRLSYTHNPADPYNLQDLRILICASTDTCFVQPAQTDLAKRAPTQAVSIFPSQKKNTVRIDVRKDISLALREVRFLDTNSTKYYVCPSSHIGRAMANFGYGQNLFNFVAWLLVSAAEAPIPSSKLDESG